MGVSVGVGIVLDFFFTTDIVFFEDFSCWRSFQRMIASVKSRTGKIEQLS